MSPNRRSNFGEGSHDRGLQETHHVALRELADGATVQRVSYDLGYGSVSAFITMFKKALGQPPPRYFAALGRNGVTPCHGASGVLARARWRGGKIHRHELTALPADPHDGAQIVDLDVVGLGQVNFGLLRRYADFEPLHRLAVLGCR
jgi:Helix-turn-helix domain